MRDFATSESPAVQAQLDRLAALSLPQGRIGLETVRALLARLGDPHKRLPPVFHVAGTNGKGSTCAFLRAMLEAAGHRVHVYTSPHLVRFNERIRVAGQLIADEALAEVLREVLDAAEAGGLAPSFFEVTTAAAFLTFARVPADACVIEVGLGGRFDATNVLETAAACGIASLGMDHEQFLLADDTRHLPTAFARIAYEKAGIAKPGVPLCTLTYTSAMNEAIIDHAARVGAPLYRLPYDWNAGAGKVLAYRDAQGALKLPLPRLHGQHQAWNAGLAIAMLRHQSQVKVTRAAIATGLRWITWPARLQLLGNGPLTALLPPGTRVWLDGAHNQDAGEKLARAFRSTQRADDPGYGVEPGRRFIHLILGMLTSKSPNAVILPLQPWLASITVVPVPGHEWRGPDDFAHIPQIPAIRQADDVPGALSQLNLAPAQGETVLIAGSLYLAGEVLRLNRELPD